MKINKNLLKNIGFTFIGISIGGFLTDYYNTIKHHEDLKISNSALELASKSLTDITNMYCKKRDEFDDYKKYVNNVISDEELDKLTREKYFTD